MKPRGRAVGRPPARLDWTPPNGCTGPLFVAGGLSGHPPDVMKELSHDEIAIAAHSIWKDRGCPEGIDNEIWLEAERQLRDGRPPGTESREGFQRRAQTEAAAESR